MNRLSKLGSLQFHTDQTDIPLTTIQTRSKATCMCSGLGNDAGVVGPEVLCVSTLQLPNDRTNLFHQVAQSIVDRDN